jgi:putative membrane protein insertion efficiency factor
MTVLEALTHAGKRLAKAPIYAYRYALSPLIGPVCRYQPTCSAYALEAIERHGVLKGSWLTLRRLARCHPVKWLGGSEGFDPVPDCTHAHRHHTKTEHAKTHR